MACVGRGSRWLPCQKQISKRQTDQGHAPRPIAATSTPIYLSTLASLDMMSLMLSRSSFRSWSNPPSSFLFLRSRYVLDTRNSDSDSFSMVDTTSIVAGSNISLVTSPPSMACNGTEVVVEEDGWVGCVSRFWVGHTLRCYLSFGRTGIDRQAAHTHRMPFLRSTRKYSIFPTHVSPYKYPVCVACCAVLLVFPDVSHENTQHASCVLHLPRQAPGGARRPACSRVMGGAGALTTERSLTYEAAV